MYSSIEKTERLKVIKSCYWPLFKISDLGIPIGIEAPGVTLDIINEIDPKWIKRLIEYVRSGKIEIIGSGYSQIIGPLVPAEVNNWNQKLGLEKYQQLFGVKPKLALVNEMAFSGGLIEHYIQAGYEGIIMEWNNPYSSNSSWDNNFRYFPQIAKGKARKSIPLIWADSIAFQKFQRYVHSENNLNEYLNYLKSHIGKTNRYFPLYSNDVEIFDYRPGRYKTEAKHSRDSEWDRIILLYETLQKSNWCKFLFPSQVLECRKTKNSYNKLVLESIKSPIPVKKQEKYNINRWALTGRDDTSLNKKCYRIYQSLIENNVFHHNDWKELCYLWSSDFRTHITRKRWNRVNSRLNKILKKLKNDVNNKTKKTIRIKKYSESDNEIKIKNSKYNITFNKRKGFTISKLYFDDHPNKSLIGMLDHGYYNDITLGADYFSGHSIIERPGKHKVTDLNNVTPFLDNKRKDVIIKQNNGHYEFRLECAFNAERIILHKQIKTNVIEPAIIRPYSFTFIPESWDKKTMFVSTNNGGSLEKFKLKGKRISQNEIYSSLISSRNGFGNTEGVFIVGDKHKSILFQSNMSICALIPSIVYKDLGNTFFLRLQYSAREMDETNKYNCDKILDTELTLSLGQYKK